MHDPTHDWHYDWAKKKIEFQVGFAVCLLSVAASCGTGIFLVLSIVVLVFLPLELIGAHPNEDWLELVFISGAVLGAVWAAGVAALHVGDSVALKLDALEVEALERWKLKVKGR